MIDLIHLWVSDLSRRTPRGQASVISVLEKVQVRVQARLILRLLLPGSDSIQTPDIRLSRIYIAWYFIAVKILFDQMI